MKINFKKINLEINESEKLLQLSENIVCDFKLLDQSPILVNNDKCNTLMVYTIEKNPLIQVTFINVKYERDEYVQFIYSLNIYVFLR